MKNSENGSDTLVQDRVSTLERELNGARALLREQERHSIAARIFLDSHILDPFTDLLDKCHRFNNRVQDIAKFLSQCLIYRPPDDFQDELDRCYSKCKEIIGPGMADLLRGQSQKAESLSSRPVPALFARIVCMVSLISISVLHIRGDVLDINQRTGTIVTATNKNDSPRKTASANEFKVYTVLIFSSLFRTAGWAIQGANNRTSFQEHIVSLHLAWSDLRGSISMSINDRTCKLSFTPLEGGVISNDRMIRVYEAHLDAKSNSESKDNTSTVIGTISLGISIESAKKRVHSVDASSVPHTEATILQSAVKAQVVSVTDLERALAGETFLTDLDSHIDNAIILADTRGRELALFDKADSLAISDLSARVTQLNEEIFQAAASLGEAVCRKQWSLPDEETIRCAEDASRLIGPYLVLATHEHAKNPDAPVHPFLVQVVLQVFLNTFCVEKIRMWATSEPIHDDYLRSLYQAICEKEEQAVSGRWRALTRSQLRPDTSTWPKELFESLIKVFQCASWDLSSLEALRTIENQLAPIFKGILEVRIALGEKFTSADIEVISMEFGQKFNRAYMEDAYGDDRRGGNTDPDTVLATAGMALRKNMPPGSQFRYEKVLPAKVILESSLKAALEPAPSRDRGKRRKPADTKAAPPPQGRSHASRPQDGRD